MGDRHYSQLLPEQPQDPGDRNQSREKSLNPPHQLVLGSAGVLTRIGKSRSPIWTCRMGRRDRKVLAHLLAAWEVVIFLATAFGQGTKQGPLVTRLIKSGVLARDTRRADPQEASSHKCPAFTSTPGLQAMWGSQLCPTPYLPSTSPGFLSPGN